MSPEDVGGYEQVGGRWFEVLSPFHGEIHRAGGDNGGMGPRRRGEDGVINQTEKHDQVDRVG